MSWFVYVVRLDERIDRDAPDGTATGGWRALPTVLRARSTCSHLYRQRFGSRPGDFPVTERVARTTLALPFFTDMTETQVDYVCDRLARHLGWHPARQRAAMT